MGNTKYRQFVSTRRNEERLRKDETGIFEPNPDLYGVLLWEHTLPIPQSNSTAAKQMRSVVILASIARAIDMHVFQPTYFLPTNAGIRDLLTRQAQEDSRKESAFRAMMQAVLPKEQDTVATSRVLQVCDETMLNIGGFLSLRAAAKFKDSLEDIIEDARDIWQETRLSTYAVQPSFALQQYENWSWRGFRFQEVQPLVEDGMQATSFAKDDPVCVIFPRLYMFDEDGEDPVTHGTVLMRSQTLAAREEMQQHPSSPGLGRVGVGGRSLEGFVPARGEGGRYV